MHQAACNQWLIPCAVRVCAARRCGLCAFARGDQRAMRPACATSKLVHCTMGVRPAVLADRAASWVCAGRAEGHYSHTTPCHAVQCNASWLAPLVRTPHPHPHPRELLRLLARTYAVNHLVGCRGQRGHSKGGAAAQGWAPKRHPPHMPVPPQQHWCIIAWVHPFALHASPCARAVGGAAWHAAARHSWSLRSG